MFSGFSLLTTSKSGERERVTEDLSKSFPDGKHFASSDEPPLLPHGWYLVLFLFIISVSLCLHSCMSSVRY